LTIYLFDEESAPLISINGVYIAPNLLLSKVGEIGNLTQQEFVAVSSLLEDDLKTSEVENEEADKDFEAAAEILAMIAEAVEPMAQAQATAEKVEVSKDDGKFDRKYIDDEGDKFDLMLLQPTKIESLETVDDREVQRILGGRLGRISIQLGQHCAVFN
jgi:hypothetical protein